MRITKLMCLIICFATFLLLQGCGKETVKPPSASELIDQGWAKFTAGNFSGASGDFSAAIDLDSTANNYDGLLGLGWAELRRNNAGLAEKAFIIYLNKVSDSNDAKAGLALACDAQDKFQDAINYALSVLSSPTNWSFFKDSRMNHLDLAYILADSYYLIANYSQSLAVVQQYFDPSFNVDLGTSEGRNQLAKKIEILYELVS